MALSGYFSTNKYSTSNHGTIGLYFSWTGTQDIANNTTTIKWLLMSSGTMSSSYYVQAGPVTVTINGTKVLNTTSRFNMKGGGAYKKTGSITVAHGTDGSKTVAMSVKAAIYSTSVNCTGSKNYVLDKIPRGALLDSTPDSINDGEYPTITYTNPLGSETVNNIKTRIKWTGVQSTDYDGPIASFSTNTTKTLKRCISDIEGYQDLNGYSKPWAGGTGKNLVFKTLSDANIDGTGTITAAVGFSDIQVAKVTSGQTYAITTDAGQFIGGFFTSEPEIGSTAYDGQRIVQNAQAFTAPIDGYVIFRTSSGYTTPQLEKGSTATSWEPYENICPIIGYTEANVSKSGKNLFKNNKVSSSSGGVTYTTNEDGTIDLTGTATSTVFILPIGSSVTYIPSGTYTMKKSGNSGIQMLLRENNTSGNDAIRATTVDVTRTLTGGLYTPLVRIASGTVTDGITLYPQLELGTTSTTYEPYEGEVYTVDFDTAGTVYKGSLDVLTGELTVTHKVITRKWSQFGNKVNLGSNTRGSLYITSEGTGKADNPTDLCTVAPYKYKYAEDSNHFYIDLSGTNTALFVYLPNDTSADTEINVCYELAEPIIVHVNRNPISTINGNNTIFSDTGDIDISYYTDGEFATDFVDLSDDGGEYTFTSDTITEQNWSDMMDSCPNSSSLTITYDLQSLMDGSEFHHTKTGIINITDSNPEVVNFSYYDTNPVTVNLMGGNNKKTIQNMSTIRFTFDEIKAKKGATLSEIKVKYNMQDNHDQVASDSSLTGSDIYDFYLDMIVVISSAEDVTFEVELTDSRGNTTKVNLVVLVFPWSRPAINKIELGRRSGFYDDTNIKVTCDYSPLDGNNVLYIFCRWKKTSDESYDPLNIRQIYNDTSANPPLDLDNSYDWDIQVIIYDSVLTSSDYILYSYVVRAGTPNVFFDGHRKSMSVNCLPDHDNDIEIDGASVVKRFSNEERCVGFWIDGSKIYEKTISYSSTISSGGNVTVPTATWSQVGQPVDLTLYSTSGTSKIVYKFVAAQINSSGVLQLFNGRSANLTFDTFTIRYTKST